MYRRFKRLFVALTMALFSISLMAPVAFAQNVTACNSSGSNGGGGSDSRACISNPEGIIAQSTKAQGLVQTLNWLLLAACLVCCIIFGVKCASRLSDEQFKEAIGPGVGSALSALIMYLAYTMFN